MEYVQSFKWIPNSGPLTVALMNGRVIASLWMPKVDIAVTFSATPTPASGNPFYTASPPSDLTNPQVVEMPPGTLSVQLSGTSSQTYYVWASTGFWRPAMMGPSSQ
jgi:hypothetical protein